MCFNRTTRLLRFRCGQLLLDQRSNIRVGDILFAVGQDLELLEQAANLIVIQLKPERAGPVGQRCPATMLAQHQVGLVETDILRPHDLVGGRFLEHPVLVDARLVGKRVATDDRLVSLHLQTGNPREELAGGDQQLAVDPRIATVEIGAGPHRHHDLFQRAIAGPLTDAVDRALDLARPRLDPGQAVGHRQPEIVVAMDTEHRIAGVGDPVDQALDHVAHMGRCGVADRVGDIDRGRPRLDHRLDHPAEKVHLGADRVLGRKLDVVAITFGPLHPLDRVLDDLVGRHVQLELAVDRTGGQEDMDPRRLGVLQRLPGPVDILVVTATETGDLGAFEIIGDLLDRPEIIGRGDRETGLDHIDAQVDQRLGDLHLLLVVHAAAGRLFTITQSRIENLDNAFI